MAIYQAKNVADGVNIALSLKKGGQHNWFRGQRQNWPLRSSFSRIEPALQERAKQKLSRFYHWAQMTPGLEPIAKNRDALFAVAQHYGLPTHYVDFTTDPAVAGFFASQGTGASTRPSCILCLNTDSLRQFWLSMPSKYPPPEFIQLQVANLWRLEAQAGLFLFCPYDAFERIYDVDRILFPFTGAVSSPRMEEVYPTRKSHLEILLSQYFMNEALIEGHLEMREHFVALTDLRIDERPERCDPDLVVGGNLPKHSSWAVDKLRAWVSPKIENYAESITRENWEITINFDLTPNRIGKEIADEISTRLNRDRSARGRLIQWSFRAIGKVPPDVMPSGPLPSLARLWDGLRVLPYADDEIGGSLGTCLALQIWRIQLDSEGSDRWAEIAASCFEGNVQEMEFGSDDGSYSRAYVSQANLIRAVRDDIGEYLSPEHREDIVDNTSLLQAIWAPEKLFDFERLTKLFVSEICPIQVLMRDNADAVFYSPARLNSFGRP